MDRGDIYHVDLTPVSGREQAGALVTAGGIGLDHRAAGVQAHCAVAARHEAETEKGHAEQQAVIAFARVTNGADPVVERRILSAKRGAIVTRSTPVRDAPSR